ncbi:MAG: hypothetical protein O3A10_07555 [Chloroflexi bacterium]|nr:hypothetical protein [Chloroflexota bacterium]MDA1145724.1 hypothetical protein [Chloroflexota bacterium]
MSDRLEREIEEILDKIEHFPTPESRRARARKRFFRQLGSNIAERQRAFASQLGRVSISQVLLTSFLMILVALFFRRVSPLTVWLLYAGIILFLTSFTLMVFSRGSRGSSSGKAEQRWRGRDIQPGYRQSSPVDRIRRWWDTRRTRR